MRTYFLPAIIGLASWPCFQSELRANPTGGTVGQGTATFSSSGSQLTINTSDRAFINWQNFNIGVGETTTFVQPSASSVVWNRINDPNVSQILGNLNANGYVILQNQNGFYIGGQAVINAHGLLLTTVPTPPSDLMGGGAWSFNTPPPTASIINYGRINLGEGGSAFLIANNIENNGSISAPSGQIGLYAGKDVLVSTRPDGRGLSAQVTLPQGSVNNRGELIADAGTIEVNAKVVNQGGLIQANSVRDVNGTIELVAGDSLTLSASSVVSAQGGALDNSDGGSVTIKSANQFSDELGSTISIAGGAQRGNGGDLEISAESLNGVNSLIDGHAMAGFSGGRFTIDPVNLALTSAFVSSLTPTLNSGLYQINLQADNTITLSTLWTLNDPGAAALLTLTAGNNIIFNTGSGIKAGNNWGVKMTAGPLNLSAKPVTSRTDGIYLDGNSYIQTQNGDVNLWAANELIVGSGAIRTLGGGNIAAEALFGDVITGTGTFGFNYLSAAPYYTPFNVSITGTILNTSSLSGISTAGGGNVSITADHGNITSFLPNGSSTKTVAAADPGTGAFGSQLGNVTISAPLGSVFGHYVVANGNGSITAGQNIGTSGQNVALSLIKGSWGLNAMNGSIYLQEVRNPNGFFNRSGGVTSQVFHLFDYDDEAAVTLNALSGGVYLTGSSLPRPVEALPIIYAPSLTVNAGAGGINFLSDVILFPSPDQNLIMETTGGGVLNGNGHELSLSDTSRKQWNSAESFTSSDKGSVPLELNNPDAVKVTVDGSMVNFNLITSKRTKIKVGGDMIDCGFSGQNLHSGDVTSIDVTGQIYNRIAFNYIFLSQPIPTLPLADLPPGQANDWKAILRVAVDSSIANVVIPAGTSPSQYGSFILSKRILQGAVDNFYYNPTTSRLTYVGDMNLPLKPGSPVTAAQVLAQPLTVVRYDANGVPVVTTGADGKLHFVTDTISWVAPSSITALASLSQGAPDVSNPSLGYAIGGPGEFDVRASSISLGNSKGVLSYGVGDKYGYLAPYTPSGASISVKVDGDLNMPASTIAAVGGGDVTVQSTGGAMELGSADLLDVGQLVSEKHGIALGIYTTGAHGDVEVTAQGNINVSSSRVAAFNGGDITVVSEEGNVDAGLGGANIVYILVSYVDPHTGAVVSYRQPVFANGIVAETLLNPTPGSPTLPGDIKIQTPRGDILAGAGGILQEALSGNVAAPGSEIRLEAGSDGHIGNISLGNSGVIGGAVTAKATGNISGLVISRQDSTINAAGNFVGTVLSGGTANLSAGGQAIGTVIGIGGVNAAVGSSGGLTALGQNVSVNGGTAQSTLGTTASATSTSQSAAQQSSSDTKQVASNDSTEEDDQKKKGKHPLLKRASRVTVILPKS